MINLKQLYHGKGFFNFEMKRVFVYYQSFLSIQTKLDLLADLLYRRGEWKMVGSLGDGSLHWVAAYLASLSASSLPDIPL